jgi:hypothetical protein
MLIRSIVTIFILLLIFGALSSFDKDNKIVESNSNETVLKCNGFSELCNKRLDEVTTLMTHNSFNNQQHQFLFPNQCYSISRQLNDGVRGLMLDVYSSRKGPVIYHGYPFLGKESLLSVMYEIRTFLLANPNEVITIIFENSSTHQEILQVMDTLGLRDMIYLHCGSWPTLKEMIQSNKRLVLMVENQKDTLPEGLLYAWQETFDSHYSFKSVSKMDCSINRGGAGLKEFYLLNHWLTNKFGLGRKWKAKTTNSWTVLSERVKMFSQEQQRRINFLGVDFYNIGDAMGIVDSLNGVKR